MIAKLIVLLFAASLYVDAYYLHKARYCEERGWLRCKSWRDYPLGNYLRAAGVSENRRENVYYSIFSKPSRGAVKYIALFTSGRQGPIGDGSGNMVSGAISGWRHKHGKTGGTAIVNFDTRSMAVKFHQNIGSQYWPASQTLILSFPDSNFDHMLLPNKKQAYLEGYANYLSSLVYWNNIKGVYLAGSSRGGCLVMQLSQKLRIKFNLTNVKFIVQSIDAVCKWTQGEFGTTAATIDNPIAGAPSSYKGHKTDISLQFPPHFRPNFCIRHILGGDHLIFGVRAFTHSTSYSQYSYLQTGVFKWYQQEWVNHCHKCLGRDPALVSVTVIPMLNHFKFCESHFWPPPTTNPPTRQLYHIDRVKLPGAILRRV